MIDATQSHVQQSRDFLAKARRYLEEDDLHQACEKGWEATTQMAKAVALAQGWPCRLHDEIFVVVQRAERLTGEARLRPWINCANVLLEFSSFRDEFLYPDFIDFITNSLDGVASLLDALEPLATAGGYTLPPLVSELQRNSLPAK